MKQPLDPDGVHYGTDPWEEHLRRESEQLELLPDPLRVLRGKLYQKAKQEPQFRFYALYDRVYRMDVLEAAWKRVGQRGKACGVDGVRAEDVLDREGGVQALLESIREQLRSKSYRPSAIRRVYIPKADGSKRPLGIPTLQDRVVQMAVVLILEPIFEADFMDCSHGFRPERRAHGALGEIRQNLQEGRTQVYDADLKSYFDTIPHGQLLACVKARVVDRSVLALIEGWLRAAVVEQDEAGRKQPPRRSDRGTPQGGVISPLLANVYLHQFDRAFHAPGGPRQWANARMIRYADDFVIMARYQGHRIEQWVSRELESVLGLKINREKTRVVKLAEGEGLDFLGFTFRYDRDLHGRDRRYLNVEPSKKAQQKARDAIREKTGPKKCFKPAVAVVEELNTFLRGWCGYFKYGYPRKAFRALGQYCRGRVIRHLNRRSQRKYRKPGGMSHYQHLQELGLLRP